MPDRGYALAQALADLDAAGLLAEALTAAAGHWRRRSAAGRDPLPGAFLGAALDSRLVRPGELFVALPGERADGRDFAGAALAAGAGAVLAAAWTGAGADPLAALVPPRDGAALVLVTDPGAALARLGACWRARLDTRVVAVTGTNGKTTTKDLLAALLGAAGPTHATTGNLNNELGLPLTLLGLRPAHRFAAIEMGASAVGDIARLAPLARPQVGVITNASPAHLARFGSLAGIIEGKGELLDALPADGTAVLNAESPGYAQWRARSRCRVIAHGEADGDERWTWRRAADPGRGVLTLAGRDWDVPLPGRHNGANLAAALLAARALGVEAATAAAGLAAFVGSPHRSRVETIGGVLVLDDCYNANPGSVASAAAALVGLPGGRAIALLGRMAELGADSERLHRETGRALAAAGVDVVVAVGAEAQPLAAGFREAGGEGSAVDDAEAAAAWLAAHAAPGDRVLVKGSRAAGMEKTIERFRALATGAAGA